MAIKKDLMGDPTRASVFVGVFPAAHFFLDFVRKKCLWGPLQVPGWPLRSPTACSPQDRTSPGDLIGGGTAPDLCGAQRSDALGYAPDLDIIL